MTVLSAKLTFQLLNIHSIKEKRAVARSLIDKTRHKFNVSVAEVDTQDIHQTLTIGIAVVSGSFSYAQKTRNNIIAYMDDNTEATLVFSEL